MKGTGFSPSVECFIIGAALAAEGKLHPDAAMKMKIHEFRNEDEEFEFWSKADSTEYLDWSKSERVKLPKLKRTPTPQSEANPR
ncbi:MAG TPA: CopG family antitoxin [Acidobacteriaceae bacterium]|nr:CopG family antitoxin [Acidobacteriaceae bacterium]